VPKSRMVAETNGARCPVCSTNRFRIVYRRLRGVDGKQYDYVRCVTCGFGTVQPLPSAEELAAFYSAARQSRTKVNIYEHTNTHTISSKQIEVWSKII